MAIFYVHVNVLEGKIKHSVRVAVSNGGINCANVSEENFNKIYEF